MIDRKLIYAIMMLMPILIGTEAEGINRKHIRGLIQTRRLFNVQSLINQNPYSNARVWVETNSSRWEHKPILNKGRMCFSEQTSINQDLHPILNRKTLNKVLIKTGIPEKIACGIAYEADINGLKYIRGLPLIPRIKSTLEILFTYNKNDNIYYEAFDILSKTVYAYYLSTGEKLLDIQGMVPAGYTCFN